LTQVSGGIGFMIEIRADRRKIDASGAPDAERRAEALAAKYFDVRLELAKALHEIDVAGAFHLSGCSSIVQYAAGLGVPASEARRLVDLGRALRAGEGAGVERRVRDGALSVENASTLGKLLARPECVRQGEDWVRRAESALPVEFRCEVNRRIEEAAQGDVPVVPLFLHVTESAREDFHRVRALASREARCPLTEGQTFTLLVRQFLDARDPVRRGSRARRARPTCETPGERYIPAQVRKAVLDRSGDRCEVPGCSFDTFLEYAHVEAHADGGDREPENLLRLCHVHHVHFDADRIRFGGWREGRPVFRDADGEEFREADVPIEARVEAEGGSSCDLAAGEAAERAVRSQVSERPPPGRGVVGAG